MKSQNVIRSGYIKVDGGHKLYFEQWGNADAVPTFFLHGGPGSGFKDKHKNSFDPTKHYVIFFDQRGSGRSTPYASTKNNTTQDLVADIELMRKKFGFKKINLWGRSWGSTLALAYALEYPAHVNRMVIGGIYLGTRAENDFISTGYMRYTYPEAWERFISFVPESHRSNGLAITQFYSDKMNFSKKTEAKKYADEWTLWEATTLSINYDKKKLEADVLEFDNLAVAKLETHYFLNDCFMPDDYIINNIRKLKDIPCYVIQGRFDNCTPPETTYKLSQAYGEYLTLQWVNAGHRGSDPEVMVAERAVANVFLTA